MRRHLTSLQPCGFALLWTMSHTRGALFAIYLTMYAAGKFAVTFLREENVWFLEFQQAHILALGIAAIGAALWVYACRQVLRTAESGG
jgi:prolipoprotein diacylglyceryltransferase